MGLAMRSSHQMKPASNTTKATAAPTIGGDVQPARCALVIPSSRESSALDDRNAPSQSKPA